jgi:hypothetical protein
MPGFIQIMEFETLEIVKREALMKRFQREHGEALLATKATITEDRTRANHCFVIVEFDCYEEGKETPPGPEIFHDRNVRSVIHNRQ